MKKTRAMKRLQLNRETVRELDPVRFGTRWAVGGASNNSVGPENYCCSTVTAPAPSPSVGCSQYCHTEGCPCSTGAQ